MKSLFSIWVFAFIFAIALIGYSSPVFSFSHPGYRYSYQSNYSSADWMKYVVNEAKLSDLSIPGTHASLTSFVDGNPFYQTQGMHITTQFNSGIRFFEFGCYKEDSDDKALYIYTGRLYLYHDLDFVLQTFQKLLLAHPSEVAFLYIHQEWSTHSIEVFSECLMSYIEVYEGLIWSNLGEFTQPNPKLQDMRGKIVIVHNIPNLSYGVKYPDGFNVQDDNYLWSNWDLYDKWLKVKHHFNLAEQRNSTDPFAKTFVNWLVGWGGSLPYFVASGHIGAGNDNPQLSTGATTPLFKNSYPDFPRTACFWCCCTISYKGTNMLTTEYIAERPNTDYFGIVVADFPGPALIDAVIASNAAWAKNRFVLGKYYRIYPAFRRDVLFELDLTTMKLKLSNYSRATTQSWQFDLTEDGHYVIRSRYDTNLVITMTIANTTPSVFASKYSQLNSQHWLLDNMGMIKLFFQSTVDSSLVLSSSTPYFEQGTIIGASICDYNTGDGGRQFFELVTSIDGI